MVHNRPARGRTARAAVTEGLHRACPPGAASGWRSAARPGPLPRGRPGPCTDPQPAGRRARATVPQFVRTPPFRQAGHCATPVVALPRPAATRQSSRRPPPGRRRGGTGPSFREDGESCLPCHAAGAGAPFPFLPQWCRTRIGPVPSRRPHDSPRRRQPAHPAAAPAAARRYRKRRTAASTASRCTPGSNHSASSRPRSQVSCRLASCRVAAMAWARKASASLRPSRYSQAWR